MVLFQRFRSCKKYRVHYRTVRHGAVCSARPGQPRLPGRAPRAGNQNGWRGWAWNFVGPGPVPYSYRTRTVRYSSLSLAPSRRCLAEQKWPSSHSDGEIPISRVYSTIYRRLYVRSKVRAAGSSALHRLGSLGLSARPRREMPHTHTHANFAAVSSAASENSSNVSPIAEGK